MLHENPVLTRHDISNAIAQAADQRSEPIRSRRRSAPAGLADQIEMLKITPATLGREEMAWLWTALKADYRPTFPFQVSVVLIEPQNPAIAPLPVLLRQHRRRAGPRAFPEPHHGGSARSARPAATLGELVTVTGSHLLNATGVVLTNSLRGIQQTIALVSPPTNTSLQFTPPLLNTPAELAAGIYDLSAQVPMATGPTTTNSLPFAIAPSIDTWAPGADAPRATRGDGALLAVSAAGPAGVARHRRSA